MHNRDQLFEHAMLRRSGQISNISYQVLFWVYVLINDTFFKQNTWHIATLSSTPIKTDESHMPDSHPRRTNIIFYIIIHN